MRLSTSICRRFGSGATFSVAWPEATFALRVTAPSRFAGQALPPLRPAANDICPARGHKLAIHVSLNVVLHPPESACNANRKPPISSLVLSRTVAISLCFFPLCTLTAVGKKPMAIFPYRAPFGPTARRRLPASLDATCFKICPASSATFALPDSCSSQG